MRRLTSMSQSDLVRAFDSYYYEEARMARHGGVAMDHPVPGDAHPLRYDERGLPIRERLGPGRERMRRRLTGHRVGSEPRPAAGSPSPRLRRMTPGTGSG